MSITVGETVGEYEVLERLGSGGVGRVYKVRHQITGRMEAMKVLLPDHEENPEQTERFLREVKLQARLTHPNIAGVLNAFRHGSNLVMIQELVAGQSLASLIAARPIGLETALDYVSQALQALAFAHEHGVVHRDVKPENMIVTPDGLLKVTDFGLAKTATDERLTESGTPVGSLYYMSPEQVKGKTPIDGRTDVYAVGGVLYELATGRRPFDGEHSFAFMLAHLETKPTPPVELDPGIPARLNDLILRAMEKEPDDRFASAAEMRAELELVRRDLMKDSFAKTGPLAASELGRQADAGPPPAPKKRPVGALIGVAAALLLLALVFMLRPDAAEETPSTPDAGASGAVESGAVASGAGASEAGAEPQPDAAAPDADANPQPPKPTPLAESPQSEAEQTPVSSTEPLELPEYITIRLDSSFGSDSAPGSAINGRIVSPPSLAGAVISGSVAEGKSSGKERGQSTVKFSFHLLRHDSGEVPIHGKTVALRNAAGHEGKDHYGSEAKHKAGTLRRIGSSIGGIFGGKKGAVANTATTRAPQIHFGEGAEFDLEVAERKTDEN